MPRRKRLPIAAPLAFRPTTTRAPQLIPFGLPELDDALGGGLPLGRLTEIIGAGGQGKYLLAARFIAARQRLAPDARVVWLHLDFAGHAGALDIELFESSGVDLRQFTVMTPRDGVDTLNRAFAYLVAHPAHVLVINGLPKLTRRDLLFVGLLERLALLLPGTRTVLLCLSSPDTTGSPLARLAAVRLVLDNEVVTRHRDRTLYQADLTVLKHRFAASQPGWRAGRQVALRLVAGPLGPQSVM